MWLAINSSGDLKSVSQKAGRRLSHRCRCAKTIDRPDHSRKGLKEVPLVRLWGAIAASWPPLRGRLAVTPRNAV